MSFPIPTTAAELEALMEDPALAPPNGTIPNFTNPYTFKTEALVYQVIILILATSITFLRIYTKLFVVRKWVLEDCKLLPPSI